MAKAETLPLDDGAPGAPDSAEEAKSTYKKVMWRILPFLMICYAISYLDRSNVGFAKLRFLADLGLNDAVYGIGAGIFYVGYILSGVPSSIYMHKVGVRKMLLTIMVSWGLLSAGTAFMSGASQFYVMRFLLGVAEGGMLPGMLLYVTYWIPVGRRARANALFTASIPIAGIVGGPISGWIIETLGGTFGIKGWQWMFLLEGLPAALLGLFAYFYLQDSPAHSNWLTARQKNLILEDLKRSNRTASGREVSLLEVLREPKVYALVMTGIGLLVSSGGIFFWLPTIIHKSGIENVLTIGILSVIPFSVALVAQYVNARHSDRTGERRWHTAVPSLIGAFGWAALPWVQGNTALSVLMLTLVAVGTLALTGPFWTLPSMFLAGKGAAIGIALVNTVGGIGGVFSPMLVGWLSARTGSLAIGQYYFAVIMALGALTLLLGITPAALARAERVRAATN